jgi:hypothetical protein
MHKFIDPLSLDQHNISVKNTELDAISIISQLSKYPRAELKFSYSDSLQKQLYDFSDSLQKMHGLFISCENLLINWISFMIALVQSSIEVCSQQLFLIQSIGDLQTDSFEIETHISQMQSLLSTLMQDFYQIQCFSVLTKLRNCQDRLQALVMIKRLSDITLPHTILFDSSLISKLSHAENKLNKMTQTCQKDFFSNAFSAIQSLNFLQEIGKDKANAMVSLLLSLSEDLKLSENLQGKTFLAKASQADSQITKASVQFQNVSEALNKIESLVVISELDTVLSQLKKISKHSNPLFSKQVFDVLTQLSSIKDVMSVFCSHFEQFKTLFFNQMHLIKKLGYTPVIKFKKR